MQQAGNIVAAIALGRILFQIPGGLLVDRYPAKYILSGSLFLLGLCTWVAGINGTYYGLLISQFFIGATGVVVWPLCVKLVVDWFSEQERDLIGGLLNTGTTLAVGGINVFVPFAAEHFGWSFAFYSLGFLAFLTGLSVLLSMKSNSTPIPLAPIVTKPKFSLTSILELLNNRKFLYGLVVYAGATYTTWGVNTWLMTYLIRQAEIPTTTASLMMLVVGICGAISMPIAGLLTKGNSSRRYLLLMVDLGVLGLMIACLPWITNPTILWGYTIILGIASFAYMGPLNLMVTDLVEMKLFGVAMATILLIWQISSMLQSLLIGYLLTNITPFTYYLVFGLIALGAITGSITAFSLWKKEQYTTLANPNTSVWIKTRDAASKFE